MNERILSDRLKAQVGARSLADVQQRRVPKAQEEPIVPEVDSLSIELRRAGISETRIKIESRIEQILELGKAGIITPCKGCPDFNAQTLCNRRDQMTLSDRGSLLSPTGSVVSVRTR